MHVNAAESNMLSKHDKTAERIARKLGGVARHGKAIEAYRVAHHFPIPGEDVS